MHTRKNKTRSITDDRIHLLLYFFDSARIKKNDLLILKKLSKYVNILPVISKADSLTLRELNQLKEDIIVQASDYKIDFYDCIDVPSCLEVL